MCSKSRCDYFINEPTVSVLTGMMEIIINSNTHYLINYVIGIYMACRFKPLTLGSRCVLLKVTSIIVDPKL